MKRIAIILLLLFSVSVMAQRKVEKSIAVNSNQNVFLNFKFADNIKVQHWNKSEVLVKATVTIDDGEGDASFSLKAEKSSGTAEIHSDFGDYFKKKSKEKRWNNHTTTTILYEVFVPYNVSLKVKSISGDLESDTFKGTLKTDLVSGDVTIKKYEGELRLKTVSGDLDVAFKNAEVNAKTLTGTIYSNLEINRDLNRKQSSGYNKIVGTVNNGGKLVTMETVSGDIFMRKE